MSKYIDSRLNQIAKDDGRNYVGVGDIIDLFWADEKENIELNSVYKQFCKWWENQVSGVLKSDISLKTFKKFVILKGKPTP